MSVRVNPHRLDDKDIADTLVTISDISFIVFGVQVLAIAITLTIYGNSTLKFVLDAVKSIPEVQWSPAQMAARRLLRVSQALRWFIAYEILVLAILPIIPGIGNNVTGSLILRVIQAAGLWAVILIGSLFVPAPWHAVRNAHGRVSSHHSGKRKAHRVGPSPPPTTPHSVNNASHNGYTAGQAYIRPPTGHGTGTTAPPGGPPSTPNHTAMGGNGTNAWPSPQTATIIIGTAHLSPASPNRQLSGGPPGLTGNNTSVPVTTRGSSLSAIALAPTPRVPSGSAHGSRGGSGATIPIPASSPVGNQQPFGGGGGGHVIITPSSAAGNTNGNGGINGGPLSPIHSVSPPAFPPQPTTPVPNNGNGNGSGAAHGHGHSHSHGNGGPRLLVNEASLSLSS